MITRRGLVCAALGVPFSPRLGSRLLLPVEPAFEWCWGHDARPGVTDIGLLRFAQLYPVLTPLRNQVPNELDRLLADLWSQP